jgi:hypothetical protein
MKKLAMTCLGALLACAMSTTPLAAQFRGVVGVGLSAPLGDFADENIGMAKSGGGNALVGVEWMARTQPVGLRLDGTWNRFCTTACDEANGDLDVKYQILNANLSGIFETTLDQAEKMRLYVLAGGGLYSYKLHGDDVPSGVDDSQSDFGISGGAGFNVRVGAIGLFIEARFHNVFTEGSNIQYVPVTVGVRVGAR